MGVSGSSTLYASRLGVAVTRKPRLSRLLMKDCVATGEGQGRLAMRRIPRLLTMTALVLTGIAGACGGDREAPFDPGEGGEGGNSGVSGSSDTAGSPRGGASQGGSSSGFGGDGESAGENGENRGGQDGIGGDGLWVRAVQRPARAPARRARPAEAAIPDRPAGPTRLSVKTIASAAPGSAIRTRTAASRRSRFAARVEQAALPPPQPRLLHGRMPAWGRSDTRRVRSSSDWRDLLRRHRRHGLLRLQRMLQSLVRAPRTERSHDLPTGERLLCDRGPVSRRYGLLRWRLWRNTDRGCAGTGTRVLHGRCGKQYRGGPVRSHQILPLSARLRTAGSGSSQPVYRR